MKHFGIGTIILIAAFTFPVVAAFGQESVFGLLKKDMRLAGEYFAQGRYRDALDLYLPSAQKDDDGDPEVNLKIARCYYELRQYREAVNWYARAPVDSRPDAMFRCAEAHSALAQYEAAIEGYRKYLESRPDDVLVTRKMWQLQNVNYLFEDSIHYAVRGVTFNTAAAELCPVPFNKGVLFMSNRRQARAISQIDARSQAPFYKLYYAPHYADTITFSGYHYMDAEPFKLDIPSRYNAGPVRFYANETKMVYVSNSPRAADDGSRTLQLFFAEKTDRRWKFSGHFPYNSLVHSISDPAINETGTVLYFSSDRDGGFGGRDIYRCEFLNGRWTEPLNLGDHVNTPYDEVFPYLQHGTTLYFSSNGHAGLGGLDIFKVQVDGTTFGEVTNLGYPLNTNFDEFGIVLDSLSTHGYLTSNRTNGGMDDDIYEFDMDVQTYPLVLNGVISFKQFSWSDSTQLRPFAHAKLYVIDNLRNLTVDTYEADSSGRFVLRIPYFSKYKIRVVGADNEENVVSLEIPKHRKAEARHEVVVVKDPFAQNQSTIIR